MQEVWYSPDQIIARYSNHGTLVATTHTKQLDRIRQELQSIFSAEFGFAPIGRLSYTDGVRIIFANGDVAHFRPSGNADELRIYSVADKQERADAIIGQGVAEPDGLLRRLVRMV